MIAHISVDQEAKKGGWCSAFLLFPAFFSVSCSHSLPPLPCELVLFIFRVGYSCSVNPLEKPSHRHLKVPPKALGAGQPS